MRFMDPNDSTNKNIGGLNQTIDNVTYLKQQLKLKQSLLENLNIDNIIRIREYQVKKEMLEGDVESLIHQLEGS